MSKLKAEDYIDKKTLEKKLGMDLNIIIKAWRQGKSDYEISSSFGVSEWKLNQLRSELQQSHYLARIKKGKEEGRL
jgi:putative AlgH/UPF0301 family transcriptional regulator